MPDTVPHRTLRGSCACPFSGERVLRRGSRARPVRPAGSFTFPACHTKGVRAAAPSSATLGKETRNERKPSSGRSSGRESGRGSGGVCSGGSGSEGRAMLQLELSSGKLGALRSSIPSSRPAAWACGLSGLGGKVVVLVAEVSAALPACPPALSSRSVVRG